jgi:cytochrome c6
MACFLVNNLITKQILPFPGTMRATSVYFKLFAGLSLLALLACGSSETRAAQADVSAPPNGKAIFKQYCVTCHGADGKLGLNGAKNLTESQLDLDGRIAIVTNGKNMMTPYGEILSPQEKIKQHTQS